MIVACTCQNTYQDALYGKQNRVFNPIKSSGPEKKGRCTVCKAEKTIPKNAPDP